MSTQLNDDVNIIANSDLEITYFEGDVNIIQKLDDEPNDVGGLTSAELKAKFDEGANIIKNFINDSLIPELLAADATESARATAEQTRETNEEQRIQNETERQENYTKVCNLVEKMTVAADTLSADSEATALIEVDAETGGYRITVGIPKGKDGKDGQDGAGSGDGDMKKSTYDPKGKAQDVFKYAEDKASEAVKAHNESEEAHPDIRALIENAGGSGEGTQKFYGTIGTNWTEDSNTGVKYQLVAIAGVTADMELGRLDTINTHDRTSEGYAAYVEEQNQFLTYITNGDAETVDGGVMFYIYGEANTVAIPFGLVV